MLTVDIQNPWAVLYVAAAGLCMNIVGMFLFHGHGHGHSHSHAHDAHEQVTPLVPNENVIIEMQEAGENPIQLRENVIRVAQLLHERETSQSDISRGVEDRHVRGTTSDSLSRKSDKYSQDLKHEDEHIHEDQTEVNQGHNHSEDGHSHRGHSHDHGHGHSHDMNMHGVFLHILGDMLTSLGVIAAVLIIIFVDHPWTIYVDPTMSLLITFVIINSTIPLVRSACYILVQGTPHTVSIDALRRDILTVDGVVSIHELHVWQLSDTQTIASVHVVVPRPDETSPSTILMEERYMLLAATIKSKLHHHGIHSTTVQPEFQYASETVFDF